MAGGFAITATFKQQDIDNLQEAGLMVTVLADLSHNANTTTRQHPSNSQVIAKAIELDVAIGRGTATEITWYNLSHLATTSAGFQIYQGINNLGGFSTLQQHNIKVEAPNFDDTIFTRPNVPQSLAAPYQAATAINVEAFNNLPAGVRQSMGMYQRLNAQQFNLSGQQESQPRTAP